MKSTALLRRTPLRRLSESQRAKTREWRTVTRRRAESLQWRCEGAIPDVCDGYGIHGHHALPRSQGGPNTYANCRWVCRSCHAWIHANPLKASSLGLLARSAPPGRVSAGYAKPASPPGFPPPAERPSLPGGAAPSAGSAS